MTLAKLYYFLLPTCLMLFTNTPCEGQKYSVANLLEAAGHNQGRRVDRSVQNDALTVEDFIQAEKIGFSDGVSHFDDDVIARSGKYEGDIDLRGLPIEAYVDRVIDDSPYKKRVEFDTQHNAIKGRYTRWGNAEIPYRLSGSFSRYERSIIAAAIADYNKYTCIKWVPKSDGQRDYVDIVSGQGCYSSVGKTRRRQELSLGRGCVSKGIVIHEMMHAVGFFHEQSRNDRDSFIDVRWDNIYNWARGNFKKLSLRQIDHLGTGYDYGSVMHYGKRYFSRNGRDTIVTRNGAAIGNRRGFSSTDIKKVNLLYGCPSDPVPRATTPRPQPRPGRGRKPRPTTTTGSCTNQNFHCQSWSEYGECKKNPGYMLIYCKRSCNVCKSNKTCFDKHSFCPNWAKRSKGCTTSTYIRRNCKLSCSAC